jgi:hypothetical protein
MLLTGWSTLVRQIILLMISSFSTCISAMVRRIKFMSQTIQVCLSRILVIRLYPVSLYTGTTSFMFHILMRISSRYISS